jgi:hypothetical protein
LSTWGKRAKIRRVGPGMRGLGCKSQTAGGLEADELKITWVSPPLAQFHRLLQSTP